MARTPRNGIGKPELIAEFEAMRPTRDRLGMMCARFKPNSSQYRSLDTAARALEQAARDLLDDDSPLGWEAGMGRQSEAEIAAGWRTGGGEK